jgi:hypothetical protein
MSTTDPTRWIKASASSANGSCIEMRQHDAEVEVRDTKQCGRGPILQFSTGEFGAWLTGAKNGEFDHLS